MMNKLSFVVFLVFLFLSNNVFSQDEKEYIAGTPGCYEKLEVSLDILVEGNKITALLLCSNNTEYDVYLPNQFINIFTVYNNKKMATNDYFLIYNQNKKIAQYFGFGTKFFYSKDNSTLLKSGETLKIVIENLEEIYKIPNDTTQLFISYYSTIAPESNTVQIEYISNKK